jgi:hypothetical protein
MARNQYNKKILYLLLITFTISFFGNAKISEAWQERTIPGSQVFFINVPDCEGGITLDIQYEVLSGPGGIDAYLVEGIYGYVMAKPTSYLLFKDDSMSDHWAYEVPADNNYCVQFFNDYGGPITLRYQIEKKSIWDIIAIIGISVSVGLLATVVFLLIRRKKKRKALESITPES